MQTTLLKRTGRKETNIEVPSLRSLAWKPSSSKTLLELRNLTASRMMNRVKRWYLRGGIRCHKGNDIGKK